MGGPLVSGDAGSSGYAIDRLPGRPAKPGESYYKDNYTWAVTKEFARRFCMPEEFIADDLKGAEAIAYWHGKPTGQSICKQEEGKEVCRPSVHGHWIELYVNSGSVPKYDPEVQFFIRDFRTSRDVLGTAERGRLLAEQKRLSDAIKRGEIPWPLGMRPPFVSRGYFGDRSATVFSYLARTSEKAAEVRAAGISEKLYVEGIYEGIDLIALEGWSNGSIAGRRYDKNPKFGWALGVRLQSDRNAYENYPDGYQHVIELPARITEEINRNDAASGAAFDSTVRSFLESMRK